MSRHSALIRCLGTRKKKKSRTDEERAQAYEEAERAARAAEIAERAQAARSASREESERGKSEEEGEDAASGTVKKKKKKTAAEEKFDKIQEERVSPVMRSNPVRGLIDMLCSAARASKEECAQEPQGPSGRVQRISRQAKVCPYPLATYGPQLMHVSVLVVS